MKKITLLSLMLMLFFSVFTFAQSSVTIIPGNTSTKGEATTFQTFSTAGIYRGYVGVYSNPTDVDFGTGILTTGKLHLVIAGVPKLTVDNTGNVGIGTTTPNSSYKLNVIGGGFIVENSASTRSMYYNPNSINDMVFTGGDANINTNASNSTLRLQIFSDTKVSIGSNSATTGKVQISHLASASSPTLHLKSGGWVSFFFRATSTAVGSEWDNHFINNISAASNLVYWTNSVNSSTPLILTGEGDAIIERNTTIGGFTKLGNDVSAPRIKMKKLSGTFNANANTSGTPTNIPHGVADPTKIITINVLGQYAGSGGYVSNSFLTSNGYQFDYQIDGANIIVTPKQGNSASLVSQNIKVVITYQE